MTGVAAKRAPQNPSQAFDDQLIRRCLEGDAEAWATLIDKYKNLIYSIPIKLGMYQDASDIFQGVCVDLLAELPRLREHRALPKWLMQITYHKCLHSQRAAERLVELDTDTGSEPPGSMDAEDIPESMLVQLEQEQLLRTAISELSDRCARMVQLLFFEFPPRPYENVAAELGLAKGSMGAIRARCLESLRKSLEKKGFR